MYRIGIDVGGTFTDLVAVDDGGQVTIAKTASTPQDPSIGVLEGLRLLAATLERDLTALLGETERIVHGTTVATNALLERKGARVGLLTTDGHRDVIEMREGLKDDRYNLRMTPPVPLVPRHLRLGVRERLRWDGSVEIPLNRASLRAALDTLAKANLDAVAICYLHSYRDPRHEQETARQVAERLPNVHCSLSSEVLPQIKEFERVCTTVVNAYVGPLLSHYLNNLGERLAEAGYGGNVLIMQSHGGVAPVAEAARLAAGAILSGPAGGIAGSRYASRLLDQRDLISFDMGGTSTDISLLEGGEPHLSGDRSVGGHKVGLPSIDIHTLGAGGGSIARVDGTILRVGPRSAGADPGPACYGLGGTDPTVTDANLVLGYLDPASFLGGRRRLDSDAALAAMGRLATQLGATPIQAAEGVYRVVNTGMAEGIRIEAARRGVDPRRFTLLAFGGAAGLHVAEVARMLEIGRVVVPRVAAVLSAWGMLATDLRFELVRTHVGEVQAVGTTELRRLFEAMETEGRTRLAASFSGPVRVARSLDIRYGEQIFEIPVSLEGVDPQSPDLVEQAIERFHRRHEELFTYSAPDQEVVLVNARLAVIGELPVLPEESARVQPNDALGSGGLAPRGNRRVFSGSWREVPVYDLDALPPGQEMAGPAIFESATTTVLIRDRDRALVTPHGWLDIRLGSGN